MNKCFVIQPFDGGTFDKRYDDVFAPAITASGLQPYRVDRDPAVNIPILDIERGIDSAEVCLADITTNNPNVWFELGFAIARKKEVILVCSSERQTPFPFDVQHRSVIRYTNQSTSDFKKLGQMITERIVAILKKEKEIDKVVNASPMADSEGLSMHEIVALVTIMQNQLSPIEKVSAYRIKDDMLKAGFTEIAASIGLAKLSDKKMILFGMDTDWNGNEFASYQVERKGRDWIYANEDKLLLKKQSKRHIIADDLKPDEDVPF